jgi:acyl-CoA synthetase (AMP-forming)/AMP-acid ligase II
MSHLTNMDWYGEFLSPPAEPGRDFILGDRTYGEIYQLAAGIYGLAKTSPVSKPAICLCSNDKGLLAAALLASLGRGGPSLVLPYAHSHQALGEVMEVLSPDFFLADGPGDFPPGPQVIDASSLPLAGAALTNAIRDPNEPFLMLFTGGSTGKPKIWPKTPRNMLAEARYQSETFAITKNDVFLSTVPPYHIYGLLFSVLIPLYNHARVLPGIYTFPKEVLLAAQEHQATILVSVPIHFRALKMNTLQRFHLRMAFSSAGMLDREDALFFREKTGVEVIEVYGSTETGGVATRRRCPDGEAWVPMAPVAARINGGMLGVRSDFLSPQLPRDEDGYFVTADCADPEGEGCFVLRGRADDIVKIGGKRIDIAAVQDKLKRIPGVSDAVVMVLPVRTGRQNELAALVATRLAAMDVRRGIAALSEAYAVPRRIVVVDELPMTRAGKYDRAAIEGLLKTAKHKTQVAIYEIYVGFENVLNMLFQDVTRAVDPGGGVF